MTETPAELLRRASRAVAADRKDGELDAWWEECADRLDADPSIIKWDYIQRDLAYAREYLERRPSTAVTH